MTSKEKNTTHIHFGVGRLGLGLIGYCSKEPIMISRRANTILKQKKEYVVKMPQKEQIVRIGKLISYADYSMFQDLLKEELRNNLIITTAVKVLNIPMISLVIALLLYKKYQFEKRNNIEGTRVYLIACENIFDNSIILYNNIKKKMKYFVERDYLNNLEEWLERTVLPLRTVVDRIIPKSQYVKNQNRIVIETENHFEWIIEKHPKIDKKHFRQCFEYIDKQMHFSDDIEIDEAKKYWILNGAHLSLYFLAKKHKVDLTANISIRDLVMKRQIREDLETIISEYKNSLYNKFKNLSDERKEDIEKFARNIIPRFEEMDDKIERIFNRPKDLRKFYAVVIKYRERLFQPQHTTGKQRQSILDEISEMMLTELSMEPTIF